MQRESADPPAHVALCLKPIKDGVVKAGVVEDDTDSFIRWRIKLGAPSDAPHPRIAGRWRYQLTITEVGTHG